MVFPAAHCIYALAGYPKIGIISLVLPINISGISKSSGRYYET